jgi:hypothetical protein
MTPLTREAVARALDRLGTPSGRTLVVSAITASTSDDARAAVPHQLCHVAPVRPCS